jgi:hypothetical protein
MRMRPSFAQAVHRIRTIVAELFGGVKKGTKFKSTLKSVHGL